MKSFLLTISALCLVMTPAFAQGAASPATPRDMMSWAGGDHYPAAALRARAQGRTTFTLAIDEKGRPTDCRIDATSGNADLDKASCAVFMHGRFNPATDDKGVPVTSSWSSAMNWKLP